MIEKHIQSVGAYIELIENVTSNPENILDILVANARSAFDVTTKLFDVVYYATDEEIRNKYLSIIFLNKYEQDNTFDNHIIAKNELMKNNMVPKFKFYYRGHYSDKYLLLPSALRGNQEYENEFYREIITRNPNDFVRCGHLERLVKMQHYECPTRLLDITSNPLVALFFACTNTGCKKCNRCNTGEVFVFAPFEKDILSFDSDKALILACLPKFTYSEKKEILDICVNHISKKQYALLEGKDRVVDRLYHEIRREVPSFKSIINPYHILSSYFIQPVKDNNRIVKQDGAFIICGQYYDPKILETKLESLLVAKIKVNNKARILKELDALGINEATLFPELDKVAHYLKEKYN